MRINVNNLIERVEETRRIVGENSSELAESIDVVSVLTSVMEHSRRGVEWSVEEELQDLIWESWGEDN